MNTVIRAVQPEDAAAVNRLSVQLGYHHTVQETLDRILQLQASPDDCVLVAAAEKEIIGWMHACKVMWLESGVFVEIAGLVVDVKYRGNRTGELLVEAAKKWCLLQNCRQMKVRSSTARTRAHNFYLKAGFTETKESKVFEMEI